MKGGYSIGYFLWNAQNEGQGKLIKTGVRNTFVPFLKFYGIGFSLK